MSTGNVGKGVNKGNRTESSRDGTEDQVFWLRLSPIVYDSGLDNEEEKECTETFTENGTE